MPSVRFQLLSIPTEIKPSFWLVALLLGWRGAIDGSLLAWVVVLALSILWHELGHALAWRLLGHPSRIELYAMGGLTYGTPKAPVSPLQRAFVSLAGPGAGFVAGGVVLVLSSFVPALQGGLAAETVSMLLWINLGWGLVNLLPILPLDGGQVLASVLDFFGADGRTWTLRVSVLLAALAAIAALFAQQYFLAMLAGWGGYTALSQLRARRQHLLDQDLEPQVDRLWEQIRAGEDLPARIHEGRTLRKEARGVPMQATLDQMVAVAALRMGDPVAAHDQLQGLPPGAGLPVDLMADTVLALHNAGEHERAALAGEQLFRVTGEPTHAYNIACSLAAAGRPDAAVQWVEQAVSAGWTDMAALDEDPDLDNLRAQPGWPALRQALAS